LTAGAREPSHLPACLSVCLSVCVLVTTVSHAKMAEQI